MPYIKSSLETKYREAATLPPPRSDDLRAYVLFTSLSYATAELASPWHTWRSSTYRKWGKQFNAVSVKTSMITISLQTALPPCRGEYEPFHFCMGGDGGEYSEHEIEWNLF